MTKNLIKIIQSLYIKKYRQKYKLFLVEGEKSINEFLNENYPFQNLIFSDRIEEHKIEKYLANNPEIIKHSEFNKLSQLATPSGMLLVANLPDLELDIEKLKQKITIYTDAINDPGNLGTIIRIADWYGLNQICCSNDTVDCYNPKTIISSMGSLARVNVIYKDISELKPYQNTVLAADMNGISIHQYPFTSNGIIMIGNESNGIKQENKKYVTDYITIPKIGKAESLNAAIATGIICNSIFFKS